MASIVARNTKDGKIVYRALVRIKGFKPVSAHFEKKSDAKEWAINTEAAIKQNKYFKNSEGAGKTLYDLLDRYMRDEMPHRNRSTNNIRQLKWWRKELGPMFINQIRPSHIAECRDKLRKYGFEGKRPCAPSTTNQYLAALSHVFTLAMKEWEWVDDNPVTKVRRCKLPPGRTRFLSESEREALLSACQASPCRYLYPLVMLAICTGARFGEIINLRWEDIDFERHMMRLEKTKNGEKRAVPLAPPAFAEVLKLREKSRTGVPWLFPRGDGQAPYTTNKPWNQAVIEAGLQDFRFHDLRHTTASYLAMNGATLLEIAAVLGHKTLQMVKRYSHVTDQHTSVILGKMTGKVFGDEKSLQGNVDTLISTTE
ncbi:MAG: site-specific integrase [Proteobacteria bacterium]|nr:site-specific integrase [Pseudomonadota bacterium]